LAFLDALVFVVAEGVLSTANLFDSVGPFPRSKNENLIARLEFVQRFVGLNVGAIKTAVRVRIRACMAFKRGVFLVLLAALLEEVVGSVFTSTLGAAVCDPVSNNSQAL